MNRQTPTPQGRHGAVLIWSQIDPEAQEIIKNIIRSDHREIR